MASSANAMKKLITGYEMPLVGLGTWKSNVGEVEAAVKAAIEAGYRHIDCAYAYGNEREVGNAIQAKLKDGTVKREDLWVTGKLWNAFHKKEHVEAALKYTLQELQLDYVDLFLIHWPMDFAYKFGDEGVHFDAVKAFPKLPNGRMEQVDIENMETWGALEECVDKGLTKTIGLSNFNSKQIEEVYTKCRIKPSVLQVECHPYLVQQKLVDFCTAKGIAVTAYSPLGGSTNDKAEGAPSPLSDPVLKKIAEKHQKNVGQVCIRWCIQRGIICIPKSVSASRIASNFEVLDWQLDENEMLEIRALDRGYRSCVPSMEQDGVMVPRDSNHKDFPFLIEF